MMERRNAAKGRYTSQIIGGLSVIMVFLVSGCHKETNNKNPSSGTTKASSNESRAGAGEVKETGKGRSVGKARSSRNSTSGKDPNGTKPSPTNIRVLNDLKKPLIFEKTFGLQQSLGAMRLDGPMDPSVGMWKCWCKCGASSCPEAARPRTSLLTVKPGKSFTFVWDGRLRRRDTHPKTGTCCTEFNPPAGRYVFTACTKAGICSNAEVNLPTKSPILIKMSNKSQANDCKALDNKLAARGARGFLRRLAVALKNRPVNSCPKTPECVTPDELKKKIAASKEKKCTLLAIPRGAEVELRAFIPLPPNKLGGENYSSYSDPHFTRVFRVRYER